jgi:uncharacterized protein Ymh
VSDDGIQVAFFATPERQLQFDELHPLIAEAAQDAWLREDFSAGLKAAWFALRDLARQRLNEPNLDGTQLMERIGDTEPRLPLTGMANDTERDMHRGVWRFLVGSAFYVRNPEMHQTTSPIADDRVGAFERLVVMSICARHLDAATSPVSVEEAVAEALQPLFPRTPPAADDLVHSVSMGQRQQLVEGLMAAFAQAAAQGDSQQAFTLRLVHLRALHRLGPDSEAVRAAARQCERWIADDGTLGLAISLLTPTTYELLKPRHQDKVAFRLIEDVRAGRWDDGNVAGAMFEVETASIFPGLPANHQSAVLRTMKAKLQGDAQDQLYAVRLACRLVWMMDDEDQAIDLAKAMAQLLASDPSAEVVTYVEKATNAFPPTFEDAMLTELRRLYRPKHSGADVVRRFVGDLDIEF